MRIRNQEKPYCVYCDDFRAYEVKSSKEKIQVKELVLECERHRAFCSVCGKPMYVKSISMADHAAEFEEYKRIKGLVTSKELVEFRKSIGLSSAKLSKALGLGDKTITRLENGDIQSESVDMLLKYAMGRAKPLKRADSQKAKSGSLLAA